MGGRYRLSHCYGETYARAREPTEEERCNARSDEGRAVRRTYPRARPEGARRDGPDDRER